MNWIQRQFRFATIPRGPILDIGSGSNPFWRANILMERYLEDDSQRPGKLILDRPMVCGDIHNIPFIDNAFSFVHCSHILEHLDNPDNAIREMMRVSKAGYIEIPSEIHEYLDLNFPYHAWAVSLEDDTLVFRGKPKNIYAHPLVEALSKSNNNTHKFIRKNHDKVNLISLFWHDEVKYRIERSDLPADKFMVKDEPSLASDYAVKRGKSRLKRILGKLLSPKINVYDILACPECKCRINVNNNEVVCTKCGNRYPIKNGIPMMAT